MVSISQYRKLASKKPPKYRSQKVKYFENGVEKTKDSKKEFRRGLYLKELEKEGKISDLREQMAFILQDHILDEKGKVVERGIKFIADYTYIENGKKIIEDVKSKITAKKESYIIKRKLVKRLYPEFEFREFIT